MHSSKMRTTRFSGRLDPGGLFASESIGGVCLWVEGGCRPLSPGGVYHTPSPHTFSLPPQLPPRGQTNITLPQTSFAGGKNALQICGDTGQGHFSLYEKVKQSNVRTEAEQEIKLLL